jgi:hypothetical protein
VEEEEVAAAKTCYLLFKMLNRKLMYDIGTGMTNDEKRNTQQPFKALLALDCRRAEGENIRKRHIVV